MCVVYGILANAPFLVTRSEVRNLLRVTSHLILKLDRDLDGVLDRVYILIALSIHLPVTPVSEWCDDKTSTVA